MMPVHPPQRSTAAAYDYDLRQFVHADQLGFAEAWIGEHFTSQWENIPAPDLFIAHALAHTKTIRFGTGVVLLPFHNPVHVALRIAQLDHLARGRLLFGVGSGGIAADRVMFGLDQVNVDFRVLVREALDVILRVWQGEPFTYEGEIFKVRTPELRDDIRTGVLMRPYQQPHPPIAVAGVNRGSDGLTLAGARGYIPMSSNFLHAETLVDHWQTVERGAAQAGRAARRSDWRIARDIYVAETTEQARRDVLESGIGRAFEQYMLPLVRSGGRGLGAFKPHPDAMPDEAVTIDYLLDNIWIVGSPEECAAKLRRLHEAVGGFGTVLMIAHDWMPDDEKWFRSAELFARKVMPSLSDLG